MTAGDGGVVVRVFPGMSLGETETGELSLEGGDALLSLSIGSDESLVVFVVNGGELESEDGELGARRHLAFDSAAEILLPNNILRFDQDMLSQTGKDAPSLPRAVWRKASTEDLTPATSSIGPAQLPPLLSELDEPELNAPISNGSISSTPISSSPKPGAPLLNAPLLNAPLPDASLPDASLPDAPIPNAPKPSSPELNAPKPSAPELNVAKPSAPELRVPKPGAPKPPAPKPGSLELRAPKPAALRTSAPKPPAPKRDHPKSLSNFKERPTPHPVPGDTPGSDRKYQRAFAAAASAGLAFVLIGLVYSGSRTTDTPEQSTRQVAVVEASGSREVQRAVKGTVEEAPAIALKPKGESAPAPIAPQATVAPETAAPEKTLAIATSANELKAKDITSTDASAAAKPFTQTRPTPKVAERTAFKSTIQNTSQNTSQNAVEKTAETPKRSGSRRTNRNPVSRRVVAEADTARAAVQATAAAQTTGTAQATAEADSRRAEERAQAALVMYERDLLAAKLALAQGRLTQPPEDNAHTLYKQLVAANPDSSEAKSGFRAVGEALVNRAFAELAAKRWNDARTTLAAAAEAGVSPNLTADLSSEVAYQQRLADAEAGKFGGLYPEAELVALNRATPRLSRFAPAGIDIVQIEFTISVAGSVQDIEVLGAPPQRLERVVRRAVTDWRFEPVLSGTRPIPVRTRVGLEIP